MRRETRNNGRKEVPQVNRMPTNTVYLGAGNENGRRGAEREGSDKVRSAFRFITPLSETVRRFCPGSNGNGKKPVKESGRVFSEDTGMPTDPLMADMERGTRQMEAMGMKRPGAGGW